MSRQSEQILHKVNWGMCSSFAQCSKSGQIAFMHVRILTTHKSPINTYTIDTKPTALSLFLSLNNSQPH